MKNMISVIIPLFNKRKTIVRTINSILNQTYKDLEVIVIDDGSTDGSVDIITNVFNNGGKLKIISGEHKGANAARNRGAREAQGEYLFFCDADIILKPYALEHFKNALDKDSKASYAYCSFRLGIKKISGLEYNIEDLKECNYISTMSLIQKKDFPGFDEDLVKFQDWDLWLTMAERGMRGVFVPEVLFYATPAKNGKSKWLPKIFYKIPWEKFGIKIKALQNYFEAQEKIRNKHGLD